MSDHGGSLSDGEAAFKDWIDRQLHNDSYFGSRYEVIKPGPRAMKTVVMTNYGDKSTGELIRRKLRFRTFERDESGSWNFDNPDSKTTWWCENAEIDRLVAFLHSEIAAAEHYRLVDTESPDGIVLNLLRRGDISPETLAKALVRHGDLRQLVTQLAASDEGISVAQAAVLVKRKHLIATLREMVQNPSTTETDVQRVVQDACWIFGGRYVGVAERHLMPLDQHDILLLGADGTLHIVELKGPNVPKLVRRHRNHLIVGSDVHEAVSQAMNYIRTFDENGASASTNYRNEYGHDYDMRRVFATVVIGHPDYVRETDKNGSVLTERTISQTIRSYNAHLSRIEVMTYKDLVDTAERALAFEEKTAWTSMTETDSRTRTSDGPG